MPKKSSKKRPAQQTPRKNVSSPTLLLLLSVVLIFLSQSVCPFLFNPFFYFLPVLFSHPSYPYSPSVLSDFHISCCSSQNSSSSSLHFVYYFFLTDELQANCGPSSHPVLSNGPQQETCMETAGIPGISLYFLGDTPSTFLKALEK